MEKNKKLTLTVSAGLFFGTALFFMILFVLDKADDWETLLSGFMALGAAIWAAYLLNKQIRQTDEHKRDQDKRKFIAARSTLPLALSQISEITLRTSEDIKAVYLYTRQPQGEAPSLEVPELNGGVIHTIQILIEHTPHDNVADRLSDLIAMLQIFIARIRSCKNSNLHSDLMDRRTTIGGYILDAIQIHALTGTLFEYSRNKAVFDHSYELKAYDWGVILNSLNSFNIQAASYDDITRHIGELAREEFPLTLDVF